MPDNNRETNSAPGSRIRSSTLARMADVPLRNTVSDTPAPPYTGPEKRRMARSPIDNTRKMIPGIEIPAPDELPSSTEIAKGLPAKVRALCAAELALPETDFAPAVAALTRHLPAWKAAPTCDLAYMIANGEHANLEVHDQFFRISRIHGAYPAIYLRSLFRGLQVLRSDLEETPTTLEDSRIAALAQGLTSAIAAGLGTEIISPFAWTRATTPLHPDHAGRRWIRGHQVFFALTQVLIFAFDAMEAATSYDDHGALNASADLAATGMQACAHALEFTGDFPQQTYNDVVRASMVSPFQPDGFSGLLSEDHRHLVKRMKLTRPTMDILRDRQPERHARIVKALGNVYESHKFVCARFVGSDKPSLLMVRETGRSAVEQLDRFKANRVKSVGGEISGEGA